jgi:CRISPR-associated exonuclease Cas4
MAGGQVMTTEDPEGDGLFPLSALNALLYCERRAALRHLDMLYVHNEHTRGGDLLHRRSDRAGYERRKGVRTERGLWIASRRLRLYGRADLVEFHRPPGVKRGQARPDDVPLPVEYKHGKKRRWENDEVQLCAQALCLEEMLGRPVPVGAIYHAKSKSRRDVPMSPELRGRTEQTVARLHELLEAGAVPPAVLKPRCRGCSLRGYCLPEAFGHPRRLALLQSALFRPELSDPIVPPSPGAD